MAATHLHASVLAGAFLLGCAGLTSAQAAPITDRASPEALDARVQPIAAVATVTEAEDDGANCSRTRRRLWVDNEGWIVRRVTTCR